MSDNVLDNVPETKPFWSPLSEHEVTPPDWLVEGWLPADSLGLLFGEASSGKSFVALDISATLASGGLVWHGHNTKGDRLPVFYLCGEGKNGLRSRLEAWRLRELNIANFKELRENLFVSQSSADLSDQGIVEKMIDDIRRVHDKPALLVIDTLARNVGGLDTNQSKDMNLFVNNCERIRSEFENMTVLIVHHTGHREKERPKGAQELMGAPDFILKAEKNADLMTLSSVKLKDGDPPKNLALKFERVLIGKDDEGLGVYSSHLTKADGFEPKPKGLGGLQETMMNHLKHLRDTSKANGLNGEVLLADLKEAWRKDGQEVSRIKRTLESLESRLMVRLSGEVIHLRQ